MVYMCFFGLHGKNTWRTGELTAHILYTTHAAYATVDKSGIIII